MYLQELKYLADQLCAASKLLGPLEFNAIVFNNIGSDFHPAIATLASRPTPVSNPELLSVITSEEIRLRATTVQLPFVQLAHCDSHGPSHFSNDGHSSRNDQTIDNFEKIVDKLEPFVDDFPDNDGVPPSKQEQDGEDVHDDHDHIENENDVVDGGEPECYHEAMENEKKNEWLKAIPEEMKSLDENYPYELGRRALKNDFLDGDLIILLLYVDDMLIVRHDVKKVNKLKKDLNKSFAMKDLGPAKQILGMRITRDKSVKRRDEECSLCFGCGKFGVAMVCTRSDIAHSVGGVSRFLSNLRRQHWATVKWILRNLRRT
ncbi:hypothetical protein RJ639_000088 [Escallonia herrerae]|uniref:Reverse transcriptase Ty1/copia-type domain-containing protein n=1 Tax=Escallonia herrerae TaxID=1293975 RepID=A0AA88XBK1_9ASTE|nr:hypothetical protein RJ639_000088 [Escallonia herrerae]